ncbi:DISARM system SNF2-like helicase DrmD [Nannocystis pusilla]|uniref:DISARM system SNF2-like helicase DrmD n=1 Tax=Nannocystis pusilla TaxID=889268 RepID=A0ABS7TMD7_9BACT|nr:DISARM system SNF2-like helicase DrmD [Nannocystis pusilla]MBZ5709389.1 DISARM system SNF2-like helicase DrmD [Nannocystis pusilla]
MTQPRPSTASVLGALTRERLFDLSRVFGAGLRASRQSKAQVAQLLAAVLGDRRMLDVLRELGRDELRTVCRAHGLRDDFAARQELIVELAVAAGLDLSQEAAPAPTTRDGVPQAGQVLSARGRQWLVEAVEPGEHQESPLLRLACLDDDAPGRTLELLWDLEIGARTIEPEAHGLGKPARLDPPSHFGAYLHALKWTAVSAADPNRFQAPFRAGIKLMAHQLTPLMKALELPRANLFIADDVGLGKTIEAGLVLQELILRQQAGFVLIVCPASVSLQWRDEMMRRFGLRFEVMSRQFIGSRRRERGFGINPWATHNRFIVSHPLIRRPEYRDSLLAHLGHRAEKGLLILDEAHVAAPASATKYALDSDTTRAIRDLAPKFDNRLFLSATPHNGHSNSFSALLEILDPIRFTRGVPVEGAQALAPIMVRRLKRDLRQLGVERFPRRILTSIALKHDARGWSASAVRYDAEDNSREASTILAEGTGGEPHELELAALLARYTELCAPASGRGRLVFINLQKRLLSSPEAFARTLEVHAGAVYRAGGVKVVASVQTELLADPETHGTDDETLAAEDDAEVRAASAALPSPSVEATDLLKRMRALADKARRQPDGKARALLAWMRAALCPGIGQDGDLPQKSRAWSDRRVILFTEYGDTKRYLQEIITEAIAGTDRADERVLVLHGGMGDEARDEVQRAFNADPGQHPVRILIATDAAREGINLQAHCADLFHVDIPWNPARLEQRNGRIDRTLQPAPEVRCHYFVYEDRAEDRVLETLVRKIDTVQRELGSIGAVLMDEMEQTLEPGITTKTAATLEAIGADARSKTADAELEGQRENLDRLQAEVHAAGQRLEESRRALEVSPDALRGVVDIGLGLAGAARLGDGPATAGGRRSFILPELDRSWQSTLDVLRPPRGRDEPLWEWRQRPPRPVTFEPLERLSDDAEQLHLAHPFIKRILDRFLAQGYGAHDLSRVCGVVVAGENVARVLAYARLTLFGPGAARLHDELIAVSAPWPKTDAEVTPYKDAAAAARAREVSEHALATGGRALPTKVAEQARTRAPELFAALWLHLRVEADARGVEARNSLARRARKESDELRDLLERQRTAIRAARTSLRQTVLPDVGDQAQQRQIELDLEHLGNREARIATELTEEPKAIENLYAVQMTRLTPVGLVIAWPEAMT